MSSAIQRRESRGLHFCTDFPVSAAEEAHETIIRTSFRRRYDMSKVSRLPDFVLMNSTAAAAAERPDSQVTVGSANSSRRSHNVQQAHLHCLCSGGVI